MKKILIRLFLMFPLYVIWILTCIILPIPILYWAITGNNYASLMDEIDNLEEI